MIFVLAARHRRTQEVAAWIIERDSLWHAMKNRGDIEAPPSLSPQWIAECDIALMEPGEIYTGDVWDQIQEAEQRDLKQAGELCEGELEEMVDVIAEEVGAPDEELPREGKSADSYEARMAALEEQRERDLQKPVVNDIDEDDGEPYGFEGGDGEVISGELLDDEPIDPRELRPFGDAQTFEENQLDRDRDAEDAVEGDY